MKEIFIVKHHDIYDSDNVEFIIGVGSTYEDAVNIIKEEIRNVCCAYSCYRYSIEKWKLDAYDAGGGYESFSLFQNIEWAKELGVYH